MPPLVAILPAIIGAVGLGEGIMSLINRPGVPKAPSVAGPTALQQQQQQTQEKAAITQQVPNVLAATSGLVNPEYVAQIAKLLSGTAGLAGASGAAKSAVGSAFGMPSTFNPAGTTGSGTNTGSPTSLSDFAESVFYG